MEIIGIHKMTFRKKEYREKKYLLQMIKGIIHQEAIFLNLCEPNSKENFVIIT